MGRSPDSADGQRSRGPGGDATLQSTAPHWGSTSVRGRAGTTLLIGDGKHDELAGRSLVVVGDVAGAGTSSIADGGSPSARGASRCIARGSTTDARAGRTLLGGDDEAFIVAATTLDVIEDVASAGTDLLADDGSRLDPRERCSGGPNAA